jgi:hypothetical protein
MDANVWDWGLIIQTIAVVVSAVAVVTALRSGARDRRHAQQLAIEDRKVSQELAAEDRRFTIRRDTLLLELDAGVRLTENLLRGGSEDLKESQRMGTEAMVLTSTLGPERVPIRWARMLASDEQILEALKDPEEPEWHAEALEAQLATNAILRELRELSVGRTTLGK